MRRGIVHGLFFFSGCSALIYELIWQRWLNLLFGVSTLSVSAVLAAFMGGLALGGLALGRWADRTTHPLRLYAFVEAGLGLGALVLPILFSFLPEWYVFLHGYLHPNEWGEVLLKVILAFPILLLWASLIGGTFPLMGRLVINDVRSFSSRLSLFYAVNTAGAVVGAGLTGFLFLRYLGMQTTLWLAAGLNLLVALAAGTLSIVFDSSPEPGRSELRSSSEKSASLRTSRLGLLAAGLAGFAGMGLEVAWARILGILTSNSAFGFALLLTVILCGLSAGGLIQSLWARLQSDPWKRLTLCQWGLLAFVIATLPYLRFSPRWLDRVCDGNSVSAVFLGELGLTGLAVFAPALLMGISFPLLIGGAAGDKAALGQDLGRVYAVNTLGCVVGAMGTGFILIPWIGIQTSVGLLLGACLLTGNLAWFQADNLNKGLRYGIAGVAVVLFASVWMLLPGGGYFKSRIDEPRRLVYYREGNNATVAVIEEPYGVRNILVDGQPVAGTGGTSVVDQKMLAHLPLLLHPDPHRALTVGFGSGGTSYSMTLHDIDVDCVEIEAAVPAAAENFQSENHGILNHPHFRLILDDARSWLRVAPLRYDVIVTDCTNIQYRSNGDLYTVDYFQLMKDRLTADGLAAAWVPANGIREADLKTLLNSFYAVFPHTSVWYMNTLPTDFLIVVGTPTELRVDMAKLAQRMGRFRIKEDLSAVCMVESCRLVHSLLLGEKNLATYLANARFNTDDRPVLSYSTYGATFQKTIEGNLLEMLSCLESPDDYVSHAPPTETMLRYRIAATEAILGHVNHWRGSERDALSHYAQAAQMLPDDPALHQLVVACYRRIQELHSATSGPGPRSAPSLAGN